MVRSVVYTIFDLTPILIIFSYFNSNTEIKSKAIVIQYTIKTYKFHIRRYHYYTAYLKLIIRKEHLPHCKISKFPKLIFIKMGGSKTQDGICYFRAYEGNCIFDEAISYFSKMYIVYIYRLFSKDI